MNSPGRTARYTVSYSRSALYFAFTAVEDNELVPRAYVFCDASFQEVSLDVRTYKPWSSDGRQKLAFWMLGDFVTAGAAPFFDLPENRFDGRSSRGYTEGRFRGDHLLYAETEYRGTLTANGLLGFVAFAN